MPYPKGAELSRTCSARPVDVFLHKLMMRFPGLCPESAVLPTVTNTLIEFIDTNATRCKHAPKASNQIEERCWLGAIAMLQGLHAFIAVRQRPFTITFAE